MCKWCCLFMKETLFYTCNVQLNSKICLHNWSQLFFTCCSRESWCVNIGLGNDIIFMVFWNFSWWNCWMHMCCYIIQHSTAVPMMTFTGNTQVSIKFTMNLVKSWFSEHVSSNKLLPFLGLLYAHDSTGLICWSSFCSIM